MHFANPPITLITPIWKQRIGEIGGWSSGEQGET